MSEAVIHICAPPAIEASIIRALCGNCGRKRRFVAAYYAWYGPTCTCLRCGDSWNEDGLCARPFERAWRPKAIRKAWNYYVRHRKAET